MAADRFSLSNQDVDIAGLKLLIKVVWLFELQLAALDNHDLLGRRRAVQILNLGHHVHPLDNLSEHHVLAIEMWGLDRADEELRPSATSEQR